MRTVVELMETTVSSLTGSNKPAQFIIRHQLLLYGLLLLVVLFIVPCTSSSTESLSSLVNGFRLTTTHVIFVSLSVEVTSTLSVDIRMFCNSFTGAFKIATSSSLLSNCCPLAFQAKPFATAVQVNSATLLSDMFTGLGGIVMSAKHSENMITM